MCYILDPFDLCDLEKYNVLMISSCVPIGKHVSAPVELLIILKLQDIVLTLVFFLIIQERYLLFHIIVIFSLLVRLSFFKETHWALP